MRQEYRSEAGVQEGGGIAYVPKLGGAQCNVREYRNEATEVQEKSKAAVCETRVQAGSSQA